ncbi:hypothetical protein LINPERHAP2_LOCUS6997 [Linum perenne]
MKDFPSCFGENGVQVADYPSSSSSSSSSAAKPAQNVVTCIYQSRIRSRSCLITVAWSRTLMGRQGLAITIEDRSSNQCLCKVEIKPWLFTKRKGSRSIESEVDIFWDLSSAKFGSGPEPEQGFYVAVLVDRKMVLFLGDMKKEAYKKASLNSHGNAIAASIFVAKKEHVFGKKVFATKARFQNEGRIHDLVLECDTIGVKDPCLVVKVDGRTVMQVKRLKWKFRGNGAMVVDGLEVEVLWDVHNWMFGGSVGNAVFMFRTSCETDSRSSLLPWSFSSQRNQTSSF